MKMPYVLLVLLLSAVGFASAQAVSSTPLKLPATDRVVIGTCYIKWVSKTSFQRLEKESFSPQVQAETDKFLAEFSKKLVEAGFKDVVLLGKCSNDDDTGGGVTAMFVFGVAPRTFGDDDIRVDTFLKVPAEGRLVPVKEKSDSPKVVAGAQDAALGVSRVMTRMIREAQPREQPKAIPEDKPT